MLSLLIMAYINTNKLKSLILDMDGVLWQDEQPIGDLRKIFNEIHRRNWRVIFATNNSTKTVNQYLHKLYTFGVQIEKWQVVNSAQTVADYLKESFPPSSNVYIVGEDGLTEAVSDYGFSIENSSKSAVAVVVGMDRRLTYEKIKVATLLIRKGAAFIGSNPDKTFPTPEGLTPGAGSILAAIEAATGVKPTITGKPNERIYNIALKRLKTTSKETLAIGDRLETDIRGAQICGCNTALVLSGVSTKEQAEKWVPKPDFIADNLTQLIFDILL